ncbi:MAG: hypothetical protein ABI565_04415 [Vicinamibacteria bacterium]
MNLSTARFVNRLRVGETTLAARAASPSIVAWPKSFQPFLVPGGRDIDVTVHREAGPRPADLLFESEGVWRAYRQEDGRLLLTFRVGLTVYKSVLLDETISQGELFFPRPRAGVAGPRSALQFPLDEMLFQHRWSRDGLLEVHSCAVRDGSGVLLFAGQSGAGKSTTARLWSHFEPRRVILSDDRVLLDPRPPGTVRAFGTPWHGTGRFGSTAKGGLRALFFLEQAAVSEAVPVHPAEAAARLFTRTFPPLWDRTVTRRVLAACGDVAERVPAFLLRFRKDETAIAAARRAVLTAT